MTPAEIVRDFWQSMRGNDFNATANRYLTPDFIGLWPQTGEVIRGPADYARVNNAFPGHGEWRFQELSLLADGQRVVTNMRISNAPLKVAIHAISFHEVTDTQIRRQTEYWPDQYELPAWRKGILEVNHQISRW